MYLGAGYNAWESFRTASRFENEQGFMLFALPYDYLFTRIEDVAELILFLGPLLLVLVVRALRDVGLRSLPAREPMVLLMYLAVATQAAMFLAGTWRTGETARACAYLYPYLLFPVGLYLDRNNVSRASKMVLAASVFIQSVFMQLIGNFHW